MDSFPLKSGTLRMAKPNRLGFSYMPTILRLNGWRVCFYSNDHSPAHVHVIGPGRECVFDLNCIGGPVALSRNHGCSQVELGWIEVN